MSDENLRARIEELIRELPDKYSILEAQLPLEIQIEYFDFTRTVKEDLDEKKIIDDSAMLFISLSADENMKAVLCRLASIPSVEAYRIIERFSKSPLKGLEIWSKLALLESRMFLESFLTDKSQVLISTGLGGKDEKLRYFMVGFSQNKVKFTDHQKKIIGIEIDTIFEKTSSVSESLDFFDFYFTLRCLMPVKAEIRPIFKKLINECNVYGGFLRDNFIVTNVKLLQEKEITSFLNLMNKAEEA